MHRHPLARLVWCLCGAGCAVAVALSVVGPPHATFVVASLGGSCVFLFGLTRAPAAQPRALFGGHFLGALAGIASFQVLGSGLPAYACAVAIALALMLTTRTVHPPAGANPVIMVYAHAPWSALFFPVLAGVALLAAIAVVWSRLYPGLARYPLSVMEPSPPALTWGGWE
ncbi:MAG TPA: HPP family protein [Burkholderiales bacterium]|nr:HPP family protein [Burkholderiales bacterium]